MVGRSDREVSRPHPAEAEARAGAQSTVLALSIACQLQPLSATLHWPSHLGANPARHPRNKLEALPSLVTAKFTKMESRYATPVPVVAPWNNLPFFSAKLRQLHGVMNRHLRLRLLSLCHRRLSSHLGAGIRRPL
jgi:hypothetical protein